jgi:hypothetical protein
VTGSATETMGGDAASELVASPYEG